MNNSDNISNTLHTYGTLLPAAGGGYTFVPNSRHADMCIIHFGNPDRKKVTQLLIEAITTYIK